MDEAIKIVIDLQNKLYSKETVLSISNESISDFKRGVIQGKIEELSIVLRALEENKKHKPNG